MRSSLATTPGRALRTPLHIPYRQTIPARADKTLRARLETGPAERDAHGVTGRRTLLSQLQTSFKYDHVLQLNSGFDDGVIVIAMKKLGSTRERVKPQAS